MDPNGFTRRGFRRRNRPNRSVVKERTDYRIPYQTLLVKIWVNYSQPFFLKSRIYSCLNT